MNHNNSTIIISSFSPRAWLRVGLVLVALATQVIAHGGFEHVIGPAGRRQSATARAGGAKTVSAC